MSKIRNVFILSLPFVLLSCANSFGSSIKTNSKEEDLASSVDSSEAIKHLSQLKVNGTKILNSNNEEIYLRGINAGGYLVTEDWMCPIILSEGEVDHKTITNTLVDRFGEEETLKIWETYRNNYWTEYDFEQCKKMGMTAIRLPFTYMSVDPLYNNVPSIEGQKYNFTILDNFIKGAEENGLYTILDLHGAYGSQNGYDHSGEILELEDVDFYSNEENMNKTLELWEATAEHYSGNPSIAAFDILNEPGERGSATGEKHWNYFDRCYDAIREIDPSRVIVFESCWEAENLPSPSKYGWENCIYSFHNYTSTTKVEENRTRYQDKINSVEAMNFNVPLYMGEFNCYTSEESWNAVLDMMNEAGWNWTDWTHKINVSPNEKPLHQGWGIFNTAVDPIVGDVDDLNTIYQKLDLIRTDSIETFKSTFSSNNTLYNVLKEHLN